VTAHQRRKARASARASLAEYRAARAAFLAKLAPIVADVKAGRRSPANRRAIVNVYLGETGLFFARLDLEHHRKVARVGGWSLP
jgi:hypothetical protein